MNANFTFAVLVLLYTSLIECRNANEFYTFRDAKATSVFIAPNNDTEKHGPNRAFQIGASYWSSVGQHNDTEFVSWTGELYEKALISQVNIFWEYAPKEVELSLSLTGDDFNVVMPFRPTFENKRSYRENFKLDMPYETKFVRITMRGAINTYFGIRHVHLVGYGSPMFMIKSGITSKDGEMCLQVEDGSPENQPRVVLDLCVNAIAAADGRELWRQNSRQQIVSAVSHPPKCLTTVDASKHGPVILNDCNDDSCTWEFMGNSQMEVKNANQLCLTQKDEYGNTAGMGNLVEKYKAELAVKASGSSDGHEEKFAVDLDQKTYWASMVFPDDGQHVASLTVDFGKSVHASRVVIDWEYQPLSYIVEASSDNITFKEVARNLSNAAHTTTDSFAGTDLKQIRVVMMKPHYLHGVASGGYVYGIRDIAVMTYNMETVVGDCRAAANSQDARDKYFVSYVSSFEPLRSRKISGMESDLHNVITEVSNELSHLRESLEETANCMDEKKDYDAHMNTILEKEQELWKLLNASTISRCNQQELELSVEGENKFNPGEDCHAIRRRNRNAKSGFYWIQPPCSKHPLRVYCDMESHSSIFVWNGKDNAGSVQTLNSIRTPTALRYQCASYGLEPFVVKSKRQVDRVRDALYLMGFGRKIDSYVPLAYRFDASNKFKDFMNIFSFISLPLAGGHAELGDKAAHDGESKIGDDLHMNAMGLSMATLEVEPFDMETSDLSAIVCSTNATDEVTTPVELGCEDIFGRSKKLYGSLNTNILVNCVEDCSEKENLYVYGTDGLYSDHSAICLAAKHAGVIGSKGTFVVSIENGLKYYEGSKQNGVQSMFYNKTWHGLKDLIHDKEHENLEHNGPDCKYSIRILPLERRCPVVDAYGSFLQLPNDKPAEKSGSGAGDKPPAEQQAETTPQADAAPQGENNFDPNTVKVANRVIDIMDSRYGVDNKTVTNVVEQIAVVVAQAKKHLRALEPIFHKQSGSIASMFDNSAALTAKVEALHDTLESHKSLYDNLLADEKDRTVDLSGDFALDYRTMKFSRTFRVFDTAMTSGSSNWGYSNSPLQGHESYVVQSGDLDSELAAEGTYAFASDFKYFDFEATFELYAAGEGAFGVAFRVRDQFNFYLFEMNYAKSHKQLVKVEEGVPTVLATNPDEGYKKDRWYRVKVNCKYHHIDVHVDDQHIFSFLYGYFGLYSRGANSAFYFDGVTVKARNAHVPTSPLRLERLRHMRCCSYAETFTGGLGDNYEVVNPEYSAKTTWTYKVGLTQPRRTCPGADTAWCTRPRRPTTRSTWGRSRCSGTTDTVSATPASGKSGFLRFRVLPQCEAGTVGAVVHYADARNMCLVEINAQEFRIRQVAGGVAKTLAKQEAKLALSRWNVLEVHIGEDSVTARAKCNVEHNFLLRGLLPSYDFSVTAKVEAPRGHRLGLKSSACESCYFDNVHVSHAAPKEVPTSFVAATVSTAWAPCLSADPLGRKALCRQMARGAREPECLAAFCAHCCRHHTRLLGEHDAQTCASHCARNAALYERNARRFEAYVAACASLSGPGFDHCRGDRSCLVQSCRLCCGSGHYDRFHTSRAVESAFCENRCKMLAT